MSKLPNIKQIAEAVRRHHGGLEEADDVQIKRVWDALPADAQAAYLDDMSANAKAGKKEVKTDAPGT